MVRDARTIARARRERRAPTLAEDRLWSVLRGARYRGFKLRRQHAIGPYVVDYACVSLRLVLEVDGAHHALPGQIAFDVQRTGFLQNAGWRVARISNAQVLEGGDSLIVKLDSIFRV